MARMTRKQLYLTPEQARRVNRRAHAEGVPEADVIRRALDAGLAVLERSPEERREAAFARLLARARAMAAQSPVAAARPVTRAALHARRGSP